MQYRSHRGGVYYTPENTMAAFRDAMKGGFAYIETDPCYTKDGVIVLHHDGTINRTCRNADGSPIGESTALSGLTYDELMEFDAGIHKGEQFKGERVPRLDELLELAEGSDVIIALDKKIPTDGMDALFDEVARFRTRICFSTADIARIETVLRRFPDALVDYDGPATEDALREVLNVVRRDNLLVWMYMDKPNFKWLEDTRKASAEKCAVVKRFARLGLGNVNNPYDVREALTFNPDVLEV